MWFDRGRARAVLITACPACALHARAQSAGLDAGSAAQVERGRLQAREEWFLRGRTVPEHSASQLRHRAYQQKLLLRKARQVAAAWAVGLSPNSATDSTGWFPLGPAPLCSDASADQQNCLGGQQNYNWVSGRATAVAIDPSDPSGNTVYVGGALGGLWKSTNAACPDPSTVSWNASTGATGCAGTSQSSLLSLIDSQKTLSVGAIAVQPGNLPGQGLVLVGTGETNSATDSYYGLGILRSEDGGGHWGAPIGQDSAIPPHSFLGIGFSQIAFSTKTPTLVVAATAGASQGLIEGLASAAQSNLGIYYSNDSGLTWNYATITEGTASVGPASVTAVVYSAEYNGGQGAFFAAVRFHGFYSSTDGAHWSRLSNQPGSSLTALACPTTPVFTTCPIYRGAIAVVPNRSGAHAMGEMYVWYVDSNDVDEGIWETVDGGSNWRQINETGITNCGDLLGGCGTENGAYNLTLAAVPNASGTDLYAGAVNLYKCTISSLYPSCFPNLTPAPPPSATFQNLTHVYGCDPLAAIARVHPSQHAMDFLPVNNGQQVVMYFANDGGIYRTLDGYAGLTSGDCATPNQFDSLNQTLGSMTQFVALAQLTDANTLLGGTQGNGSPATANLLNGGQWANVNSGDGGYSEINPDNPDEWFTENTGVSIQQCGSGIACQPADFIQVVSSATVGGDSGPLYTPYMLDPQNSAEMIVGTCRVWRGATSGAGFTELSQNFETLSDTSCTGSEVNMVRALAAGGGPVNGLSSVIYAGTDGSGPLNGGAVRWTRVGDDDGKRHS